MYTRTPFNENFGAPGCYVSEYRIDLILGKAKAGGGGGGGRGGGTGGVLPYMGYTRPCAFSINFEKRSGKWIKTKTHTYRISVAGRKRITMKKMTENITGPCVCGMRIEFNLPHNMQFYRFENALVDRTLE